jgi:hypothetical protein
MARFNGYLFNKLQSIGTKSEGPAYYLQQWDYKELAIIKKVQPWEKDPALEKFMCQKVTVIGDAGPKGLEYQQVQPLLQAEAKTGTAAPKTPPPATRNWYAQIDSMPPSPAKFRVTGEVQVGNPGIEAQLSVSQPQGINPAILLMDLNLTQKPGPWPQEMTWVPAKYEKAGSANYTDVEIFFNGASIARIKVVSTT